MSYVIEDSRGVLLEFIRLDNGVAIQHGNTVDPCADVGRVCIDFHDLQPLIAWLAAGSSDMDAFVKATVHEYSTYMLTASGDVWRMWFEGREPLVQRCIPVHVPEEVKKVFSDGKDGEVDQA